MINNYTNQITSNMIIYKNLEIKEFKTYNDLDKWLTNNYFNDQGIWLRVFKVNSKIESVTQKEFVEAGLCWGWIDGLINSYDDQSYLIRFTPRGRKSIWSKINVKTVERLIKEERMKPNGMLQVEAAKKDGRWQNAYEPPSTMTTDKALLKALEKNPKAKAKFQTLTKQEIYSINFSIANIKPQNKSKKIQNTIRKLEE
jgi:uncharacterized protein YdeI (YjbR/CyaY-like superfamily)